MTALGWLLLALMAVALFASLSMNWWQSQQLDELHGSHARPRDVPPGPDGTSARRMPQRVESAAAAGGSAGPERAWSVPSGPAAVPLLPLDYTPDGWTRDARGLHPPVPRAPRHAGTEPRLTSRVTERTMPRKRTADHAPWETDHFAVIREEPYVPVYGQAPVARVLEAERLAQVMQP